MKKYLEETTNRMGVNSGNIMAWAKGEARLGLNNSLFVCVNGNVTQYVDSREGEIFYEIIKNMSDEKFNLICEEFFNAVEKKDLETMHIGLAIFNELDEYNLGSETIKRRLLRIRISTEKEAYNIKTKGETNFIIYKCKLYPLYKEIK